MFVHFELVAILGLPLFGLPIAKLSSGVNVPSALSTLEFFGFKILLRPAYPETKDLFSTEFLSDEIGVCFLYPAYRLSI